LIFLKGARITSEANRKLQALCMILFLTFFMI